MSLFTKLPPTALDDGLQLGEAASALALEAKAAPPVLAAVIRKVGLAGYGKVWAFPNGAEFRSGAQPWLEKPSLSLQDSTMQVLHRMGIRHISEERAVLVQISRAALAIPQTVSQSPAASESRSTVSRRRSKNQKIRQDDAPFAEMVLRLMEADRGLTTNAAVEEVVRLHPECIKPNTQRSSAVSRITRRLKKPPYEDRWRVLDSVGASDAI